MKTCTIGSFPKIPEGSGPSVRTAIQRFERGAIGPRRLYETYQEVTGRVLDLARECALDVTSDGQIPWYDWFDPLCRDIDNLNPAGLLRLFDNNFYYRHPIITGRLQFHGGILAAWTRHSVGQSTVPILVALPGPFTIAALAEDHSYHDQAALLADLVEILQLEAESLAAAGIYEVQWDEPALAFGAGAWPASVVRDVYRDLLSASSSRQSVALYWGPSVKWLEAFEGLPVSRVSVDLTRETDPAGTLGNGSWSFDLGLGLIDARDIRLEDAAHLARTVEPILQRHDPDRIWLHPNSGLELLPPDRAARKVQLLKTVKAIIQGREE